MKKNIGSADSYLRFMVGLAFLINIYILETGAVATVILLGLGIVCWVTAWTHFCGAYTFINFSSADGEEEEKVEEAQA